MGSPKPKHAFLGQYPLKAHASLQVSGQAVMTISQLGQPLIGHASHSDNHSSIPRNTAGFEGICLSLPNTIRSPYLFLFALKRMSSIVAFRDPDSSSLRISLEATSTRL